MAKKKPDRLPLPLVPEGVELPQIQRRKGETVAAARERQIRQFRKDAIVKYLSEDASISEACAALGIERQTHYNWLEQDLEYAARCMAAETAPMRQVKKANYINALKPNGHADRKLLLVRKSWGGNGKMKEEPSSSAPMSPGDAAKKIDELDDAAAAKLYHDQLKRKAEGEA